MQRSQKLVGQAGNGNQLATPHALQNQLDVADDHALNGTDEAPIDVKIVYGEETYTQLLPVRPDCNTALLVGDARSYSRLFFFNGLLSLL